MFASTHLIVRQLFFDANCISNYRVSQYNSTTILSILISRSMLFPPMLSLKGPRIVALKDPDQIDQSP